MKRLLCLILPFVALSAVSSVRAQNPVNESGQKIIAALIEQLNDADDTGTDFSEIQEQLEYLMAHRINLNTADRAELKKLFFLSETEIRAILMHRQEFGNYLSVAELQTIPLLSEKQVEWLTYFVSVDSDDAGNHSGLISLLRSGQGQLLVMTETDRPLSAGYASARKASGLSHYPGSPYRLALRGRYTSSGRLSLGFNAEKDKGEAFFSGSQQQGFDFYSVHFLYKPHHRVIKTIILGDYQVSFGQGLTFGTGIGVRKSGYILNVRKNESAMRPYRSLSETGYLRGGAIMLKYGIAETTLFLSFRNLDATISQSQPDSFSSIQTSGLHRTATELKNKARVAESVFGLHTTVKTRKLRTGFTYALVEYPSALVKGQHPYQLFHPKGKSFYTAGLDFALPVNNAELFGEIAYSSTGGFAGIAGVLVPLHAQLDLVLLYRNYMPDYFSVYTNPFSGFGDGRNEKGLYSGLIFKLSRQWQFNLYVDCYRSYWLKYLMSQPSSAIDRFAELQYIPGKRSQLTFRYHNKVGSKSISVPGEKQPLTVQGSGSHFRIHARFSPVATFQCNSRFEYALYHQPYSAHSHGSLFYQDVSSALFKSRLTLTYRAALFYTEEEQSAIYAIESDMLYQYAAPAYSGSGTRHYLLLHYRLSRLLDVWLKYAETRYREIMQKGSGPDLTEGDIMRNISMQLRCRF